MSIEESTIPSGWDQQEDPTIPDRCRNESKLRIETKHPPIGAPRHSYETDCHIT
jgi:hypothetical protein